MKRAGLLLLLALATGCATSGAEQRLALLEEQLAQLRTTAEPPRLGGPEASEPVASAGAWVPVQATRKTLLGFVGRSPFGSSSSGDNVRVTGTQTISGAKTFSATITSSVGSGSNGLAFSTDGARLDLGTGANDYLSSNGTSITSATQFITSGLSTTYVNINSNGYVQTNSNDSTGSPGAVTMNSPSGKVAVANGASSVTVTSGAVTGSTSRILVTPLSSTATNCAGYYISSIATGSFVLTCPSAATANWSFQWFVIN